MKPSFLIIGSMKCGTTSLHDYLGKHPDVYTTTPKEIHFFTRNTYDEKGIEGYFAHFDTTKMLAGASPQNYTKRHLPAFSGVPERLSKHLPDVKLIYLVRDPVERIVSHFNEAQALGLADRRGLNEALSTDFKNHHFVQTSMYFFQLEEYLKYFTMDQILVIESERLRDYRIATLNHVFDFLGVAQLTDETMFDYQENISQGKVRSNFLGDLIRRRIPPHVRGRFRHNRLAKRITTRSISYEVLEPDLEADIRAFLKADVEQLRSLTGQAFGSWSL